MSKSKDERFEYFLEIKSLYLNLRKNENGFVKSWEKFNNNSHKLTITNRIDAQFYADCENFIKLIVRTRLAHKELDRKWDDLVLRKSKAEKIGKTK